MKYIYLPAMVKKNHTKHEINFQYKNINRETSMMCLGLCSSVKKNGERSKRGLIVKPIISPEMNPKCQL